MLNKKKLFLLIPSLQTGGMERVMSELSWYFCQHPELEVHLVLYGIKRDIFYQIPKNLIVHIPDFVFDNRKRFWHALRTLFFLRSKIKKHRPDSILSFGEYWNSFVLLALFGLPYPIYVSDRCQPDKNLGYLHDRLRNWLYPKAAGVIAQTEKAKWIYDGMFNHHNIIVIGNPIREIPYKPNIIKENIVLSVGRLIQSKHHDELIKLFVRINKPGWKLIIVGDDAQKQQNKVRLETLINDLEAKDLVYLAGKQINVEDFYLCSKIFAFTSSSEGFPNVIGEAQSAGLPVIAFDCIAGPSDMIKDGQNGFLVPLFDYNLFSQRLIALMDNAALRETLGQSAQKSIQAFSVSDIGTQFLQVLTKS